MVSFFSILALGFFLGMRHATDADHVVAVTTIVSKQKNIWRAAVTGMVWGFGHTLTIFVVGAGIILFNLVIPPRIGLSMEFAVGLMLIILGYWNVRAFFRTGEAPRSAVIHSHQHTHGGFSHTHTHVHLPKDPSLEKLDRELGRSNFYQWLRPLIIGLVHGLAGSAAVALLVLTTIRDPRWAVAYLLIFGGGTVAGMMLITMSIASAFRLAGRGQERFTRRLGLATGLISLAFGLFVAYQIGFSDGLFTGHPHWTPR